MQRFFGTPQTWQRQAGFTLIELLVVLAIMSLVAVVAATTLSRKPGFVARSRVTAEFKASLLAGRDRARQTGAAVAVALPADLELDAATGLTPGAHAITFFADGSSSGGTVSIAGRPALRIDWLTGAIDAP
jgi:prepilin-type N-terminal cleavage/methylation domain-containing protein